jgi:glycosyltransferase involved in cell wall biosynthesis
MEEPLVSVLTPSFNQGRFLPDCIASVRNQTCPVLEHIICDGGSIDDTLETLRQSSTTVRWLSEPDRGQAHAINKAFALSRGDIIGWLNSDDAYFDRRAIEAARALFVQRPDVDVVYGHAVLVGADNELLHFMWAPRFRPGLFRYANFIVQPTVFLRRSALGDTLVDERLDHSIDRELWLRLMSEGRRFERLDLVAAIDRHHEARKVYTHTEVGRRESDQLYEAYGVHRKRLRVVVWKTYGIVARLIGVRLIRRARMESAFGARVPSAWTLLKRQVATRRRRMPLLSGPTDLS